MATRTKTKTKKVTRKKKVTQKNTQIIVRVEAPTTAKSKDLEPMKEAGKFSVAKTWISDKQVMKILQKTPPQHVFKRKGKAGLEFDYVTGTYVKKVLNYVFGWLWDFEIIEHGKEGNLVWVLGKLTVKDGKGNQIVKNQFGRADIKFKRDKPKEMVDYGNDLKAAATDALKKCASELGIASDIYGKNEFKDVGRPIENGDDKKTIKAQVISDYVCHGVTKSGCGNDITKQVNDFSMKIFGKPLCGDCQKLVKQK